MNPSTYLMSKDYGRYCKFTFKNGEMRKGVIREFFLQECGKYYFVPSHNMLEFQKYQEDMNQEKMKELCVLIDLAEIVEFQSAESFFSTINLLPNL
jgi:hypothetical protein